MTIETGNKPSPEWCDDESSDDTLLMGVRQIWVRVENQRQRIASKLVDIARREFVKGGLMKTGVAFSQPTAVGQKFAFSYIKKDSILTYG